MLLDDVFKVAFAAPALATTGWVVMKTVEIGLRVKVAQNGNGNGSSYMQGRDLGSLQQEVHQLVGEIGSAARSLERIAVHGEKVLAETVATREQVVSHREETEQHIGQMEQVARQVEALYTMVVQGRGVT